MRERADLPRVETGQKVWCNNVEYVVGLLLHQVVLMNH
jgi:hypothetical protein